ncbi:MAG: ABC transporter ATP-binding protein/permease [Cohaesibacter sp.]|jgi:ATP-binding cassette subfamily C protein|nr:ABC transporter ATP-binding protein/permease [Cohaesibacter sp.]
MKDFAKIFGFFFSNYKKETLIAISLVVIAGIFEAFGMAAFLPFFQLVLDGSASMDHIPDGAFRDILVQFGIELTLLNVSLFIIVVMGLKALVLWLGLRKVGKTVAHISARLRRRLLEALLNARWNFFVNHTLGVSLNAIVMETFNSSMAFMSMARVISAMVQFLVYAIGALLLSWKMFLAAITVGLLLAAALWTLVRVARSAGLKQIDLSKKILTHLAEMLQGIKPLRAMALEGKFMNLLTRHSQGLEKAQADQLIASQSMRVFHEPLMVLTAILGMYGAVTYGGLSSSELAVLAVIFIRLLSSMNIAQSEFQRLMTQEAALWSLMDTIDKTEQAKEEWSGTKDVPPAINSIRFEDIDFAYDEALILQDVNLDIKPRQLTALIGPSGSGKTTILDMLSGFHGPKVGQLLIEGDTLENINLTKWRRSIGFVPQEVFLFNDSIRENILMGRDEYSEDDVWLALEAAGAREFVESLPDGLDSAAGEGGRKLSGGQRQRIAIARAMIHQPKLLLLDEATSALDTDTEKRLLETLKNLAKDVTVIFISHNKIVQDYADEVYIVGNKTIKPMESQ